jgi:hypothetical protein
MLVPDPLAAVATPIQISEGNYGRIPRVYIYCQQDKAVSFALQKQMVAATPCQQLFTLQTGHSPFLADPEALVDCLMAVAELELA